MNAYVVILQKVVGSQNIIKPYEEMDVLHKSKDAVNTSSISNIWENYYENESIKDKNS